MGDTEQLFFELIQVAIGRCNTLSREPSELEWKEVYDLADKHAVAGVVFATLEELVKQGLKPPTEILLEWIGQSEQIKRDNLVVSQRCKEIEDILSTGGFRSCVLKGQGTALYYKNSQYRQSGDIDVWVTKDGRSKTNDVRRAVWQFANSHGYHVGHVDIKHSDVDFFEDVPVEVHYIPSWMFSPFKNKRLQSFFVEQADRQFGNKDVEAGFTHTTIEFDMVYSLVHIYRHVFEEGIGLRQLLDYYHILIHSNMQQRKVAYVQLEALGMGKFAGGIMYMLHECFKLESEYFVCEPNERHGRFLLSEILAAGNFGHYDSRYQPKASEKRFANGLITLKRDMHYLSYYPSEVMWMPFWKLWHWGWRKKKGYI